MRVRTLTELMHLSINELFDLAAQITIRLAHYHEASPERPIALTNLRNIRRELTHREFSP